MPPQTPKEHLRYKKLAPIVDKSGPFLDYEPNRLTTPPIYKSGGVVEPSGRGTTVSTTPIEQSTTASPYKEALESIHIPGASTHEILYSNGDNAPTPDRIVIPRDVCSGDYSGEVPANPLHERLDNYGNRWLEGGFEYPPYEGHISDGQTSDDIAPETHGVPAEANLGPKGDEPPIVTQESEQSGVAMPYDGADVGARTTSGHTGSRSDKWPASGLTNFKIPRSSGA